MIKYPKASNSDKLYLETQKRVGKSGIRTHNPYKTDVKCTLISTRDYEYETKTQYMSEIRIYDWKGPPISHLCPKWQSALKIGTNTLKNKNYAKPTVKARTWDWDPKHVRPNF